MTPSSPSRRSADLPPCDQRPGQVHRGEQAAAQRQRGLRLPDKAGPKTIDGIEHGIEVDPVAKSPRQARHREEGAREQPQRNDDVALERAVVVPPTRSEAQDDAEKGEEPSHRRGKDGHQSSQEARIIQPKKTEREKWLTKRSKKKET